MWWLMEVPTTVIRLFLKKKKELLTKAKVNRSKQEK